MPEIRGILRFKMETQKNFNIVKRSFVVEDSNYTGKDKSLIIFALYNDKCRFLDQFNEGADVIVNYRITGKEWNGPKGVKYFNTIEAIRINLKTDK